MGNREIQPLPGADSASREAFLDLMRSDKIVAYLGKRAFRMMAGRYLHHGRVPICGNFSFISFERNQKGKQVGIKEVIICVNVDHYHQGFSQDFSDVIPYEVEHETQELYYVAKEGMNPLQASRRLGHYPTHGLPHYLAIRRVLEKAYQEGMLERYMEFVREQFQNFTAMGDIKAMDELAFYREYAERLNSKKQKLK